MCKFLIYFCKGEDINFANERSYQYKDDEKSNQVVTDKYVPLAAS